MTGADLNYEQPYGIRPVKRAMAVRGLSDAQATRVRDAADAAAVKADERLAELRAVTAKAARRGDRAV
jgi:hypothetical protein